MAPNKKKKKPAGNPARGFATTSIASKPKADKLAEPDVEDAKKENALDAVVAPQKSTQVQAPTPVAVTQTPEELEAQLQHDELQLLAEKHASKVRRESKRQALKFQTDRRVLRSQSQSMTVHEWLSPEIMDGIIALARAESNDSNRKQGPQSLLKILSEEDAMSKLWTLDLIFRDLGFPHEHLQPVFKWLCANAVNIDPTSSTWGFQEALEWLALDQCEGHSFSYEEQKAKRLTITSPDTSRPGTPSGVNSVQDSASTKTSDNEVSAAPTPNVPTPSTSPPAESDLSDITVSDLDSDLEEDQLVPLYLKIRGRLFEIDPDIVEIKSRKQLKGAKGRNVKSYSPAVRKLLSQLQRVESDALFDRDVAEAQWPAKRTQIAQTKAASRLQAQTTSQPEEKVEKKPVQSRVAPVSVNEPEESSGTEVSDTLFGDDDSGLLADMFSAIPDSVATTSTTNGDANSNNVVLRDFGKQSGLAPRRLLEEAVRSRDPGARLVYKVVSPTTYSCRHSLTITWSKVQDIVYDDDISGVISVLRSTSATFEASTIAAVSLEQSESFISTVALFSIFASSTKEEKLYLRLPATWRDLYRDFLEHRKGRIDTEDRNTIKHFRSIVEEQLENEESDGVVLTSRFKMRNQAGASSSTPNSGTNTPSLALESLMNLWYQKTSTFSYQRMLQIRNTLPVSGFKSSILATVDQNQVTIICGETGCGKSTQIPSFILEHELSQGKPCKIYCTEPRRISAISLAQRVSEEIGEGPRDIGTTRSMVGYAIRLESKMCAQTRLVFATVGVVLRMLESPNGLEEVTHLIIDEVHERSIDTDFLLIVLRSLMLQRPELKVILMSATVDSARFSMYLNNAPVLNVPGRTFPVQTKYLEDAIEFTNYTASPDGKPNDPDTSGNEDEDAPVNKKSGIPSKLPGYSSATRNVLSTYDEYPVDYDLVVRLIESVAFDQQLVMFSSAFLVFLPGIAEIRQLNDILLGHPSFDKFWLIYPLHSTIASEDQQAAFQIPPPGVRKIVLSTNIAETGVTIPDITCVIDTGKHKEMRFDERRQLSRLAQSFISRANAKQRRGRAGRVQEGLCFHLFTKYRHDNLMAEQQTPEMLRLSLQDLVMRTKICKLGDIEKTLADALDPPSTRNVRRAIDALIEVDALTPGEELTPLGRQLAKLPLDAHLGKLVLLSSMFKCVDVAITIAAILSSKSPFVTPFGARQRADIARLAFKKGDSDLLTAYNAYKSWKAVCLAAGRSEVQYCQKNFLSSQNLGNIEDLKSQLLSSLADAGFVQLTPDERRTLSRYRSTTRHRAFVDVPLRYDKYSNNELLVNAIIATAFYPKILTREGKGWRNISNNQTVSLAPTSVNKATAINPSPANFLSYYHIMQSTNKFYNAHSTSIVYPLSMILLAGADVDFKLHAGVISFPGNVLKFAVKDWRAAVALKVLRRRVKEILSNSWKNPGRQLSSRESQWLGLFFKIFEEKFEKDERIKERGAAKGK